MTARVLQHRAHTYARNGGPSRQRGPWRRWLPLALMAIVLAGCARVATSTSTGPATSATPAPTATPIPIALTWQAATAPSGGYARTYSPAPSNGNIAYACDMAGSSQSPRVAVWSTQDRGATWSNAVTFAVTQPAKISGCLLKVDADDPRVLTVTIQAFDGSSPPPSKLPSYISDDGGKTSQALPQAGPHFPSSLASYNGVLYVVGNGSSATGDAQGLWVSTNGGQSWTIRNSSDLQPNPNIWLNPQNGDLLGSGNYGSPVLYHSTDGGASWSKVPVPGTLPASTSFVVAPNGAGWHICAASQMPGSGVNTTNALTCSDNLGATWTQRPALNPVEQSPKGFTFTTGVDINAITTNGTVVATYDDMNANTQIEVLMPGASTWTPIISTTAGGSPIALGTSAITLTYTPAPGDGMFWVASGTQAPPFFTAMYP